MFQRQPWPGLDASLDKAIRSCEVDLEGRQILSHAFRAGCGELALLLLRYGADPDAVPLHDALWCFRGRLKPGSHSPPSDPRLLPSGGLLKSPTETFALARALCELLRRQGSQNTSNAKATVESLSAARVALARETTQRVLFRTFDDNRITSTEFKEAMAREAGIELGDLDASEREALWMGWPTAFLTFGKPMQ